MARGRGVTRVRELLTVRTHANERFFAASAEPLARLCRVMAERFSDGGRLIALGASPQARSDARHVAVEFVHPVIVGKRALPARALTGEHGVLREEVELAAEPGDVAIAFGADAQTVAAIDVARRLGCLTIAFEDVGAEWNLTPPPGDAFVRQELTETAYHVLWELVHVFFEHRGGTGRQPRATGAREPDPNGARELGAAGFLYPFLSDASAGDRDAGDGDALERVIDDVRGSIAMKAREISALRAQTLDENAEALIAAADALRERLHAGGTVLALGNGGSATDAMDAVADLRAAPADWAPRRAIDLTEDPSIVTAIANDVGIDAIFSRQVIAHGRPGDALLAFSTSGGSANIVRALAEARERGLATVALVGYDGGEIAAGKLADHVIVTRSQSIPRIQEAQASAWHVLRDLIELDAGDAADSGDSGDSGDER
ncbi:MAG: SIS domain-containing protein [Solirubrobacteraceae bacterium]